MITWLMLNTIGYASAVPDIPVIPFLALFRMTVQMFFWAVGNNLYNTVLGNLEHTHTFHNPNNNHYRLVQGNRVHMNRYPDLTIQNFRIRVDIEQFFVLDD